MNIYGQTNDYAISKDNSAAEVEIYSSSDFSEKEEKPIAYLPQPKINWKKVHMEMMHGNLD
jgi:hypothetical protein